MMMMMMMYIYTFNINTRTGPVTVGLSVIVCGFYTVCTIEQHWRELHNEQ
jgi:hypothetical protein